MPIRVQCQCGQSLNVPDTLAGKTGKCPKCSGAIKIPGSSTGSANPSPNKGKAPSGGKESSSKEAGGPSRGPKPNSPTPTKPAAVASKAGMDDLFEEVGLVKKKGSYCPHCDAAIPTGTALCVKCGFNLTTGQKLTAFETESSRQEFENTHLNEAAQMMRREDAQEARTMNAGTPWWVMLCALLAFLMCIYTGVILVDARQREMEPATSMVGYVQRLPVLMTLSCLLAANCTMISVFAHFAVVAQGFREKALHGWGCLLIPLYSPIYGLTRIRLIRGTVVSYWLAILIGAPTILFLALRLPR